MREHGTANFSIDLLEEVDGTRYEGDKREAFWIAELDAMNPEKDIIRIKVVIQYQKHAVELE
jgi:hypothetical protein